MVTVNKNIAIVNNNIATVNNKIVTVNNNNNIVTTCSPGDRQAVTEHAANASGICTIGEMTQNEIPPLALTSSLQSAPSEYWKSHYTVNCC